MNYQVSKKIIPSVIVYWSEAVLPSYSHIMQFIPGVGAECRKLNPELKCTEPSYSFCEFPDMEYKESDVTVRYSEAVDTFGKEGGNIRFTRLPETKVLSVFHKGPYDKISGAYGYIMKYAAENGYKIAGMPRECYIDGIWNKESEEDWLTELQLPVE